MDYIFDLCVKILLVLAKLTGFTYKEINVIIFCIIWPIITIILFLIIILQQLNIYSLKNKYQNNK
jgi:hypothetical protein